MPPSSVITPSVITSLFKGKALRIVHSQLLILSISNRYLPFKFLLSLSCGQILRFQSWRAFWVRLPWKLQGLGPALLALRVPGGRTGLRRPEYVLPLTHAPGYPWKGAAGWGSLCPSSPDCPRMQSPSACGGLPLPYPVCGPFFALNPMSARLAFLLRLAR